MRRASQRRIRGPRCGMHLHRQPAACRLSGARSRSVCGDRGDPRPPHTETSAVITVRLWNPSGEIVEQECAATTTVALQSLRYFLDTKLEAGAMLSVDCDDGPLPHALAVICARLQQA